MMTKVKKGKVYNYEGLFNKYGCKLILNCNLDDGVIKHICQKNTFLIRRPNCMEQYKKRFTTTNLLLTKIFFGII